MPVSEDLRQLLMMHAPADAEEARIRQRMLSVLSGGGNPFSGFDFRPGHFTGSALTLSPVKDEVLLIFHPFFQRWIQPGGHVEAADADLFATACRELLEETGLSGVRPTGRIDLDLHQVPKNTSKGQPPHLHFDVRFWLVAEKRDFEAVDKAHPHRWIALEEIASVQTDASVRKAVRRFLSGEKKRFA